MICCYSVIGVKCFLIAYVVWMRASNIHYQWKSNWSIFWHIHNSLQSAVTNFDVKYFIINKLISILSFLLTLGSWSLEGISSEIFYCRKWKSIMVYGPRICLLKCRDWKLVYFTRQKNPEVLLTKHNLRNHSRFCVATQANIFRFWSRDPEMTSYDAYLQIFLVSRYLDFDPTAYWLPKIMT